ncbi:MAG: hypothetical protein ACPGTP_08530, partial [Bacteroidia bacterium]
MKWTALLGILITLHSFGQQSGKVSKGSLGISTHLACPQNEIKDIKYDEGLGIGFSYLSRKYPYKSKLNFQMGAYMDFSNMQSKKFEDIELADPGIVGLSTIKVSNKMFGLFALGRINFGINQKATPYLNLLVGQRSFNTLQNLSLDQPGDNPEYITDTTTNKIVYTQRFHYGGGIGLNYKINNNISLDAGVTYTIGETGAILPLVNVNRLHDGNEIDYNNYKSVRTDILLINVGIQFHLFKTYTYRPYVPKTERSSIPNPSYKRYK